MTQMDVFMHQQLMQVEQFNYLDTYPCVVYIVLSPLVLLTSFHGNHHKKCS